MTRKRELIHTRIFSTSAEDSSKLIEANSIDIVVEVCGAKSTVPEAMRVLKPGGLYILVGMIHPDSHLNLTAEMIMRKCLTIRGIDMLSYFTNKVFYSKLGFKYSFLIVVFFLICIAVSHCMT